MTTSVPLSPCLNCGYELDSASHVGEEDAVPTPGDVTMCIKCSHIMVFTKDLGFRNPTTAELDVIARDDNVTKAVIALARISQQS